MKSQYTVLFAVLLVALFGAGNGGLTSGTKAGVDDDSSKLTTELRELQAAFAQFKSANTRNEGLISNLSRTSPPVGTVVAFSGAWPPKDSKEKQWSEEELGWLVCDGRKLQGRDFAELKAVLAKDTLPDYRGYFLRGVDVSIDGRTTSGRDKDGIRPPGKDQGFATALPTGGKPFATNTTGDHNHHADANYKFLVRYNDDNDLAAVREPVRTKDVIGARNGKEMKNAGNHSHEIDSGGDSETRPINVAVYWIIKYK